MDNSLESSLKKRVCVISLGMPIQNDPRTGRQIEALMEVYDVTVIGFGCPTWTGITWREVDVTTRPLRYAFELLLLVLGKLIPMLYETYFWTRPRYQQALAYAAAAQADAYHASDWAVLPIAARAAQQTGGKVVYDMDEYWPLFQESSRLWLIFFAPLVRHVHKRYARFVNRAMSVAPAFTERYRQEYGIESILVYNAPEYQSVPEHPTDPNRIRLIHHGAAQSDRKLETLVEALALLEPRFTLDFLLGDANPSYVDGLRQLADQIAPGRVKFRETITYDRIVQAISDCDIELCYMAPTTYTWLMTLPNKLFEAMNAGLAVLVAPSPSMVTIVRENECGWVAAGFSAQDIAAALTAISYEDVVAKRQAALVAASKINAATEMPKVRELYRNLLRDI